MTKTMTTVPTVTAKIITLMKAVTTVNATTVTMIMVPV